ncbi:LPS export ABC transporter permease LptG [Alsobacter metallidurans]|uniref:LPS export ABC transporter permease LptG n=1 Tax=Alsobacter metallidurans TaxID=340221 RepID=A0A917I947_9HYPH|nr:LPS export ABC transporter permease LptG [Alsobacter metallidurans]GGH21589.1 LPS export ABC transporter permease LptG [Alsobacter metallidurans]
MMIGATLGRYLAGRFIRTITGVFVTVFVLIYTLDFVELVRRTGDVVDLSTALLAELALFRTPAVAEQILPFAVLFGSMAALLNLSRKLELVVMRAAGVSVWQFMAPALGVAVAIGVFAATVYNPVSAKLKERAIQVETSKLGRSKATAEKELWIRQRSLDGQAIIRADRSMDAGTRLSRVTVFEFAKDGSFESRVEAREALLRDGYWELVEARLTGVGVEPQSFASYNLSTNLTPDQVRNSFTSAETIPFWELPNLVKRTEAAGLDATRYRLQFQSLLARPLLFIAMALIAASVSLRFFRFGGVAKMVLGGVTAGFVLYVVTHLVEDLGAAGLLSTTVAAWSPAVVGSLLGTLALLYQEDG